MKCLRPDLCFNFSFSIGNRIELPLGFLNVAFLKNEDDYPAGFNMKGRNNKTSRYTGLSLQTGDKETSKISSANARGSFEEMLYKMDAKPKKDGSIFNLNVSNG